MQQFVCVCGRLNCRLALENGDCALLVAEEGPVSLARLAELMDMGSRAGAEVAVKRAIVSFVAAARRMGFSELVAEFTGIRAGLLDAHCYDRGIDDTVAA